MVTDQIPSQGVSIPGKSEVVLYLGAEDVYKRQDVVIIGVHNRAEIWSAARWNSEEEEMTPEKMAALMDSLGM